MAITKLRGLQIADGTVDTTQLANSAVTEAKINDGAVTADKIGASAVTEAKINDGAVTADKLGASAVTEAKINDGAVTAAKLGASAVETAKINDGAVTADKIGASAVTEAKINNGAVSVNKLATSLDFSSAHTVSVATPTANAHAATKAYVDSVAEGLDVKESVLGATTASFTMASTASSSTLVLADGEGGFDASANSFTHDNVTFAQNDRILIKNGVNSNGAGVDNKWNGIYTVGALDGATLTLTRASDFDDSDPASAGVNITSGAFTFVERGDTNADAGFVMTQDNAITLGTTAITWSQFSGAGSFSADNGVKKTGSNFSLNIETATNINYYSGDIESEGDVISSTNYEKVVTFYDVAAGDGTTASPSINSGFFQVYLNGVFQQVSIENGTGDIGSILPSQSDCLFDTSAGELYFPDGVLVNGEDIVTLVYGA
jgi:hypothetical protein